MYYIVLLCGRDGVKQVINRVITVRLNTLINVSLNLITGHVGIIFIFNYPHS